MLLKMGDNIVIGEEIFDVQDLLSVFPDYENMIKHRCHYYDGKRHYVSDGRNQVGMEVPYLLGDRIFENVGQIRLCKKQREIDDRHIEHLRQKAQG